MTVTSVLVSFSNVLFSIRTASNKTGAVLMEKNTSVKEANREVIMAKTLIMVSYLAARSNLKPLVRSSLQWKVRQICSKIDGGHDFHCCQCMLVCVTGTSRMTKTVFVEGEKV